MLSLEKSVDFKMLHMREGAAVGQLILIGLEETIPK